MAILGHTVQVPGGQPVTIYGETDNINYFLSGDLDADAVAGPTNIAVSAAGGQRRRYPGGPLVSFSGASREVLVDPSRSSGSALPGKNFLLRETGNPTKNETRQFTFKGRMVDLHAFLRSASSRPFFLYGPSGARYSIPDSTEA
jgi:hypothetical protein